MQFLVDQSWLIPVLPLLAAICSGFFADRYFKAKAHWPVWIGVGGAMVWSLCLLFGMIAGTHSDDPARSTYVVNFYDWISAGTGAATLHVSAGFLIDPLTVTMLTIVTGIGLLITVFSAGYMKGEEGYSRFFAYLGLFIFSMTCLVMGSNLVMLYLGWEGVGLCSYLLIGYYYQRPSAAAAANKAFIVNRIGDFGFAVGIMLCFYAFGNVDFLGAGNGNGSSLLERAHAAFMHTRVSEVLADPSMDRQLAALKYIPFLLMLGAFGKSAQFPLYVWLPDAMEGPTPVSALIHAATMVTAGVYMMVRCGTLFVTSQGAMTLIAVVGAFTALFAATIAMRQFDLKKVFAYSTVSQLGYMFVAVGVLAPTAAVFHLVTHAFFKALLFLSSGVVMHAMLGHLDLRKMSGLKEVLPKTRWVMLVGCLALAGCPLFSGFFSKDLIVGQTWGHSTLLGLVLLSTSFITAYYTFRLYFRVFHGPVLVPTTPADADPSASSHVDQAAAHDTAAAGSHGHADAHGDDHHHHEPSIMLIPLYILAAGAFGVGWLFVSGGMLSNFLGHSRSLHLAFDMAAMRYGGPVDPAMFGEGGGSESWISLDMLVGAVVFAAGVGVAYLLHYRDRKAADSIASRATSFTRLLDGKYWIDELYDACIVEPLRRISQAFFWIDRVVVDTAVWFIGLVPQCAGFVTKLTLQRGYLQGYAATMFFGVLAILLFVFL